MFNLPPAPPATTGCLAEKRDRSTFKDKAKGGTCDAYYKCICVPWTWSAKIGSDRENLEK